MGSGAEVIREAVRLMREAQARLDDVGAGLAAAQLDIAIQTAETAVLERDREDRAAR